MSKWSKYWGDPAYTRDQRNALLAAARKPQPSIIAAQKKGKYPAAQPFNARLRGK